MQDFDKLWGSNKAIRVDLWLVAARVYKTRGLAQSACTGGLVKVNDQSVKPSQLVKSGDEIRAESPSGLRILVVKYLADKRLSAPLARELYDDRSPPRPPKDVLPDIAVRERGAGRPTKADRRALERLRTGDG
jgi:ribosome-associated heat shock protein Hsp15